MIETTYCEQLWPLKLIWAAKKGNVKRVYIQVCLERSEGLPMIILCLKQVRCQWHHNPLEKSCPASYIFSCITTSFSAGHLVSFSLFFFSPPSAASFGQGGCGPIYRPLVCQCHVEFPRLFEAMETWAQAGPLMGDSSDDILNLSPMPCMFHV